MLLVTGATGFLGRQVVNALAEAGHGPIRGLVHRRTLPPAIPHEHVELVHGDVRDYASLERATEGVEAMVHLVAIIREGPGDRTFQAVNHQGTANVVKAAQRAGVQHLVHLSAIGARPDPRYRYAQSKWLGEQEVVHGGVPYTILRPSILFGAGDEFFNTLSAVVKLFPLVPVAGKGQNRFQPIAVEDVARCVALTLRQEAYYGQTLEVGGPGQYTYDQLLKAVIRTLGVRRLLLHVPVSIMRLMAAFMELALPRPPVTREELGYLDLDNVATEDSVQRHFGFSPKALEEGLDYIRQVRRRDALAIMLGRMPRHIRDH